MALTDEEAARLETLLDLERARIRVTGLMTAFWLTRTLEEGTLRSEALRLVTEAKEAKQQEIDNWPVVAQAKFQELKAERDVLVSLENKLS